MTSAENRTALITGGAKGIGLACATAFGNAGFNVTVLGRDLVALKACGFEYEVCDVTSESEVSATLERIGQVDILINNAGIATTAPVHRTTLADWNSAFAVNATGAFLCTRGVLVGMRQRNWGRIVTVASTASHSGASYIAAYAASKHAVMGLMRVVASEVEGSGVTANSVCPTFVRTEMTEKSVLKIVQLTGCTPLEAEKTLANQSALGRLLEPQEVAQAVIYLCSDSASAINGQSIIMDGGTTQ